MGSLSVFQRQRRSVMGALRKRFGAVRPEKGKMIGWARGEVSTVGPSMRSLPSVLLEVVVVEWAYDCASGSAGPVDLSYSMVKYGAGSMRGEDDRRCCPLTFRVDCL